MSPGEELVRALRHGEFGFRGSFERGGYLSIESLKAAFGGGEDVWSEAFRLDRNAKRARLDFGRAGYLRALQGHSSDCGHELSFMAAPLGESAVADLQRSHCKYIYHGTDIHVVEGIVAHGLLPGGGPGGRLANHFVVGTMPTQWSEARGFRRRSNTLVQCDLEVLRKAGVRLFQGADGVLLADAVPPEAIFRILGADNKRGAYTEVLAEIGRDRMLRLVRDFRAEAEAQLWMIPRLLPAARMTLPPWPVPGARVAMKQARRSPAPTVTCQTRRPQWPPRPRSVPGLQMRLDRSALQPMMTSTWVTPRPRPLLPTRALP